MEKLYIEKIFSLATNTIKLEKSNPSSPSGESQDEDCCSPCLLIFLLRHGLSYTSFVLTDLKVTGPSVSDASLGIDVSVTVRNTGSLMGSEVVQLYVSLPPNGTTTPKLQLRGFAKVRDIPPGKNKTTIIKLDKYALSFWDSPSNEWKVVAGRYGLHIGTSSDNILLETFFDFKGGFTWSGI